MDFEEAGERGEGVRWDEGSFYLGDEGGKSGGGDFDVFRGEVLDLIVAGWV